MPDLQGLNERVLAACRNGDLHTLERLFQELNIGPDQPQQDWDFEKGLTENEHTPSVIRMVHHAIQGRQSDTLSFLWSKFPGTSFAGGPIAAAINTVDSEVVKTVCKLDPAAPNSASGHSNVLALACASEKHADVVRVLLENGADPNRPPEHIPPYSDISYAVTGHLPLSTFEQFFDAGYHCNDVWCMNFAIRHGRYDVVELLFTRGKDLPTARYETQEKLLGLALEKNDDKMADLIRRLYPVRKKASLMDTLMGKFQR